jgi:hypothetical protein
MAGEIECKVPQPLDQKGARALAKQVAKDMPHLKTDGAAWNREAARRAGLDLDSWMDVLSGKKKVSSIPSPKTPVKKVTPVKPVEVRAMTPKPAPKPVISVEPLETNFDWDRNLEDVKDVAHRNVLKKALDSMGSVVGKRAIGAMRVEVFSKAKIGKEFGKGVVGAHVRGKMVLSDELLTAKFAQEAKRMQGTGFWARTKNLDGNESTIVHEIGHELMERVMTPSVTKEALKELAKEIGSPLSLGHEHVVARWLERNKSALGKLVSKYGTEEPHELFAEMWVIYIDDPTGCPPAIKHFGDVVSARLRL